MLAFAAPSEQAKGMTQIPIPATSAIKGVLCVSAAVFLFAAGDTAAKVLFAVYSIPLVLALRYTLNVLILLAVMLCSLLVAVAIPGAFGDKGLLFAGGYVALQLGRSTAMAVLFRREGSARMRNMARIAAWFAASAPLWLAGALADDPNQRIAWWLAALAIEYAGPMLMFPVPGLGKSTGADWDISGSHMAERCSLFIIIALGEGIVVTGSSVAGAELVDGGLLGALWAQATGPRIFLRIAAWQHRLIAPIPHAELGLTLLGLWLLIPLSPEILLFGAGDLRDVLGLGGAVPFAAESFVVIEARVGGTLEATHLLLPNRPQ